MSKFCFSFFPTYSQLNDFNFFPEYLHIYNFFINCYDPFNNEYVVPAKTVLIRGASVEHYMIKRDFFLPFCKKLGACVSKFQDISLFSVSRLDVDLQRDSDICHSLYTPWPFYAGTLSSATPISSFLPNML